VQHCSKQALYYLNRLKFVEHRVSNPSIVRGGCQCNLLQSIEQSGYLANALQHPFAYLEKTESTSTRLKLNITPGASIIAVAVIIAAAIIFVVFVISSFDEKITSFKADVPTLMLGA
jgi:type II secretory pathway component PulF